MSDSNNTNPNPTPEVPEIPAASTPANNRPGHLLTTLLEMPPEAREDIVTSLVNEVFDDGAVIPLRTYSLDQLWLFSIYLNIVTGVQLHVRDGGLTELAASIGINFADIANQAFALLLSNPKIDHERLRSVGAIFSIPRVESGEVSGVISPDEPNNTN